MSVIERLRSTQVSARIAAVCIIAVLLVSTVVVIVAKNVVGSQPNPLSRRQRSTEANKARAKVKEVGTPPTKTLPGPQPDPAKNPEGKDPYAVIVERNLFKPLPQSGDASKPPPGDQGFLPPMPIAMPIAMPANVNLDEIKKQIVFTGVVTTADGIQALLENLSTKETRFVAVGDSAFDCRVVSISPRKISLNKGGAHFMLNIGENKPDVGTGGESKPKSEAKNKPPPPPGPGGPPRQAK